MKLRKRNVMLVACGALAVITSSVVFAQQQTTTQLTIPAAEGSLAALTGEVRLLRLAVEKSAQAQSQIQALSVYLSAQQSRLIQVSARADTLRKELDTARNDSMAAASRVQELERALAGPMAQPQMKSEIEQMLPGARQLLDRASRLEAQLRDRESAAASDVQNELTRWSDLIVRLEQAVRQ